MTECAKYHEYASAYADGELDVNEATEFREHLAVCGDCRAEYHLNLEMKARASQAILSESAPAGLRASILESLTVNEETVTQRALRKQNPWKNLLFQPPAIAALVVAVLLFRPSLAPVDQLACNRLNMATFQTAHQAVGSLGEEAGIELKPINLNAHGVQFIGAAPLKVRARTAVVFRWEDASGSFVTLTLADSDWVEAPRGQKLSRYGSDASHVIGQDGTHLISWESKGRIAIISTDLPLERAAEIQQDIAAQIEAGEG